jgi:TolB protein
MSSWPMRFVSPRFSSALLFSFVLAGCEREGPSTAATAVVSATAPATGNVAAPLPTSPLQGEALPAGAPPEGHIVFVSERDGRRAIYRVPTAGGAAELAAKGDLALYPGPIGPAGQILVVASHGEEGPEQIGWLEGGALKMLEPRSRHFRNPSWFPDGEHIALESDLESFRDLHRVALRDGDPPKRLTKCDKGCFEPDVHPSGKRIAYASSDGGDPEIHLREADGSTKRLTYSKGHDGTPRHSPDGKRIAFISARKDVPRVFVMGAEGQEPRMLSRDPRPESLGERDHAWSPDGSQIAFVEQLPESRTLLRVVDAASGAPVSSSDGLHIDEAPAWAPDGAWLAFTSNRDGQSEIYLMKPDGSAVRRLTDHPAADWLPRWQP